nr:hypothetical protein BaRGS_019881 [Batillaria attramentaria]
MNGSYSCNLSLTVSMSGHAFDTTYQIYGISSSHHTALSAHCYTCTCPLQYEWSVTEDQNTTPISLAIDDTSTDTVTVTCIGWLDVDSTSAEAALLYEVKAERDGQSYLLYYGTRQTQTMYLAPWPGTGTNATMVVVSVLDEAGARTQALRQPVSFTSTSINGNNASQQLLAAAQAMLPTLMQQGDPVPLLQYALALTQLLNSASTTAAGSQATEDLMAQTLEFSAEYQTSGSHLLLIQSLQNIVTTMSQSVQPGLDREDFAFRSLLSSAYHLMEAVNLNLVSSTVVTVPMTTSALTSSFPDLVHMTQDLSSLLQTLDFTSTITETHKKYVVTEAFDLAEDIIGIVLESLVLDEDAVTFTLGGITIEGTRITVESVGTYVELNGCRFILPPNLFAGLSNSDEILKIVMMLDTNPFTWGYIGQHVITSRVPTLSFKYPDGSDLPISDLSDSIELVMFSSDGNNYTISNGSLIHSQHYDPQANLDLSTWTLGAGEKKKLVIDATNGSSSVAALNIQVRVQALPNATSIIKAYLGAGFEASDSRHTDFKEIKSSDMSPGVDHRQYTFFISDQDFKKDTEYSITLVNQDAKNAVNISAGMYLSSCQFFEESGQAWAASGCSVSDESIPIATACHCNHLTAFGGSSLVPISSIRFTDLASLELGLNPVALATICSILALYIVLVIVCRYLDRADLCRISLVPLCGRDGAYKYHITVTTGRQLGAGTTAHVGIKLYGDNGKSELRHLTKSAAFQRNSCDSFLIATDNKLGCLHKLRVWHDNTGPSPCWYLTQVVVRDLQSGQRYVFPASTWLSLQVEDGKLQKEICATDPEELHSFSRVFTASLANGWGERHMWLSVLNRPDHNRFTRVQRVTCCVTLIYLYMFINAMWYGLVKDQADAADSLTWDAFGWEEVIIALVSVVVVFPIALVLICVFKRSRSKPDMFKQALRPQSAQTLEIEAMCDMSQYGGSLRAMTPNDDWMTLFERESTTESIPGSVHCIQRTQNLMWSQENILKSWPEKLPSFAEEEKEKSTSNKPSANRMQVLDPHAEETGCRLPWFCVYIGYAVCAGLSLISVIMVLLYGYNFGPAIALKWLLSLVLTFLISAFVLEPLKVVLMSLFVAIVVRDAEKDMESDAIDVQPLVEANEQLKTIAYVMLTAVLLAVSHVYFGSALYRSAGHIENNFVYTDDIANGSPAFYNISRKVEGSRQCVGRLDFTEDTHAYSTGWNSTSGNASWVYSSASQLKMRPKFGQSLLYEGGGYIQELGTTYNQTLSILQQLSASEWLDRRSRALFMEFTVYSAARDLFSCITLLLEFPISGGVLASHSINTQRLYISSSGSVDPLYICQIAGQVRFIRPLSVYIRTLGAACSKLTGATLIFLILLLTYAQIGYLFYGTFVSGYRSFQNTLFTLLGVVRGGEDLSEALEFQPIFSYFFFTSFYAFVYGLFVALVIAILQDAYKLTRSQMYFKSSLEPQDYEMIEFMLKRLKLWMGNTKPKPVELIEKEEQRQVKRVETAMDRWNSSRKPPQKKRPHLKKNAGPTGKPPVDPKSKFSRFRSNFQTSNAVGDQATKPTAPAQQDKTDSTHDRLFPM